MEIQFLERLLDAAGPSGFEVRPARVWREEAESFADRVSVDVSGNSVAEINPKGSPRVMLAGHVDEIGLQITPGTRKVGDVERRGQRIRIRTGQGRMAEIWSFVPSDDPEGWARDLRAVLKSSAPG